MRVLLVDDHVLVRQGLRALLEEHCPGVEVVAEASDGREALEALREQDCDLMLADIHLPMIDGVTLTRLAKQEHPDLVVLGITASDEPMISREMVAAGARRVLPKYATTAELCRALRHEAVAAT
jgi:DNA-binding NarL/FixJ family response regulator